MGKLGQEPDHFYIQENSWALCRGKPGQTQTLQFDSKLRRENSTKHSTFPSRLFSLLTHVFGGEHVADHDALVWFGGGRGDIYILPLQFSPRHQHHNVVNVCDVRNHLQSVIHHCFLGGEERWRWKQCQKTRQDRTQLSRLCKSKLGPDGVFFFFIFFIICEAISVHVLPTET